ncbi:hypothetical protein [Polyangium mundeleinium]|uniref:Uncharacterized protein n=1 Tax=Polyangium mundeleinium TaxID=2995306 RepID=A0ABT5F029_9BACT|nr:hypothetical protein [Polyangium mundeleinium]MDC0747376.1 hypothetical protein [Polyangium mundeleinium]
MSPLISLSVERRIPPNSIRTYFSTPLLSAGSVPPYSVSAVASIPSTFAFPPGTLIGAFPSRMTPPQSPAARSPGSLRLVKTMGSSFVPSAWIRAPGSMTSVPSVALSPLIVVPGSIVSFAPARTCTIPFKIQSWSAVSVRSDVMLVGISLLFAGGVGGCPVSSPPQPMKLAAKSALVASNTFDRMAFDSSAAHSGRAA